jgi:hypothetical protein
VTEDSRTPSAEAARRRKDRIERRARLDYLRRGARNEADPVAFLGQLTTDVDADVQYSAIQGLLRHSERPETILALAQRLQNRVRPKVRQYLTQSLEKAWADGGLILTGAFFTYNSDGIDARRVVDNLVGEGKISVPAWAAKRFWEWRGDLDDLRLLVHDRGNDDLRAGLIVGAKLCTDLTEQHLRSLELQPEEWDWAEQVVNRRVPGLLEVLRDGQRWPVATERLARDYVEERWGKHQDHLRTVQNQFPPAAFAFATASWRTNNPLDHPQSLHDAWLEAATIAEVHPENDEHSGSE